MLELWNILAARANVTLDTSQHHRLSRYLDLLLRENIRMNLTRITDRGMAEVQHVGDALTVLPLLPQGEFSLADVGTGGGVPGIPLAIARPDARVLLIESTKKKALFLQFAVVDLGLKNVRIYDDRAEEAGQSDERETFDVATARAVATLDWLAEWCLPLVKVKGKVLAMKGRKATEELLEAKHAIRQLGGGQPITHPVDLPGTDSLIIVEIPKVRKTDPRYPRSATTAKGAIQ